MNNKMNIPLSGIIPPLVTPLLDDDVLDVEGLQRLIEHLIAGGVHALFVLGTTGESQSLSYKLRVEMIKNTCRIAKGRLPVLVCISDTSIVESVNLACLAADHGADAVVSAPPYYFATGQPELIEFYEHLLPQLPLPLFLYNMPTHTKVSFAPATIQRIAENPGVIGFKDSSANTVYFQSVMYAMKDNPDFSMLVGPEEIMAEFNQLFVNLLGQFAASGKCGDSDRGNRHRLLQQFYVWHNIPPKCMSLKILSLFITSDPRVSQGVFSKC